MPTGYTQGLYDGDQRFEVFALHCARAFGATVSMRDEPWDQLPAHREVDEYYQVAVDNAHVKMRQALTASDDEIMSIRAAAHEQEVIRHDRDVLRNERLRERYHDMLRHVEA